MKGCTEWSLSVEMQAIQEFLNLFRELTACCNTWFDQLTRGNVSLNQCFGIITVKPPFDEIPKAILKYFHIYTYILRKISIPAHIHIEVASNTLTPVKKAWSECISRVFYVQPEQ